MGIDPSMLLGIAQAGTSAVPAITGIMDRLATRFSPQLGGAIDYYNNQFYNGVQNNPYGDTTSGYGGMFGMGADGRPIQTPEASAYAMMGQMGNSPFQQSMQGMQQLSQQQSPFVQNSVAPMSNLLGYGNMGFQQPGGQVPAYAPNVQPQMNFQGMGAQQPSNPQNVNVPGQLPQVNVQGPNFLDNAIQGAIENRLNPQQPQGQAPQIPPQGGGQGGGMPQYGGGYGGMGGPGFHGGGGAQTKEMPMAQSMPMQQGAQAAQAVPMQAPMGQQGQMPQQMGQMQQGPSPSLPQQLFSQGVSMTPQIQQQLMSGATDTITAGANNQQRQLRDSMPSGSLRSGQASRMAYDTEQNRVNQISNTRRDIGTQAAMQNFQDLMGTANMQFGMNRDLSNQMMQQNQFNQGVYNQNFGNSMGLLNQQATMGGSEQARQQALWGNLNGQFNQANQYPQQALDRATQLEMARITPSAMATFPASSFGQAPAQAGGGGGGSSMDWLTPLAGAAGSYFGSR